MILRPRWRKVVSDLSGNLARSVLVVASVAVGLFAVGMIATLHFMLASDLRNGYAAIHPSNILLAVTPFNDYLIDWVENLDGVQAAEGRYLTRMRLQAKNGEWLTVDLNASEAYGERKIDQLRLLQGYWPDGKHEIAFDRAKWAESGAALGEQVLLELPSGKTRSLRLVGIVQDQTVGTGGGGGGFFLAPLQCYINMDTLEWLGYPQRYNRLHVTVQGDTNDLQWIATVTERVRKAVKDNRHEVISVVQRRSIDHPNTTYLDAMGGILLLLGLLVVFLSSFLITNTIAALLNQQVTQIGILKTFGGRRVQIMALYLLLLLIFGILAFILGVISSLEASYRLLDFLAVQINFVSYGRRAYPLVIAMQLALALVVPQFAGLIPIIQGTQHTVQEALTGIFQEKRPPKKSKATIKSSNGFRISRLKRYFSRPLLLSLRYTFRRKGRLAVTLLTLSLGGALFIATFNTRSALEDYIGRLSRNFLSDVSLTLDRPAPAAVVRDLLERSTEVDYVEAWAAARSEIILADGSVGESVGLSAPPPGSRLVQPILMEGRFLTPGDDNAIVLSDLFRLTYPDLKIGDTLKLRINSKETDWIVVGFFQLAGSSGGYYAYTPYDYLAYLVGQPGRALMYKVVARKPNLTTEEQKALGVRMEALLKSAGYNITEVSAGRSLQESSAEGLDILTIFLLIMAGLTALVGGIGLTGTMSLNVLERTREIGVMRAIGATNRILFKLVLVEGILIGILSWGLASLLAIPITQLMSDIVSKALFGAPTELRYTALGFFAWLGVVIALAAAASLGPARNATRMTIREVLAYE